MFDFMEKVILLADKSSNSWVFAQKIQEYLLDVKDIKVPLREVSIKYFRNNEIDMEVPENVRKKEVYFIHDSNKNPQEWWVELLLLKDLLLSASIENLTFVLPDIIYNRKHWKDRPHVPISARTLAKSISPNLKRVITMDLHSPQIQGFYPEEMPLDNLYSFPSVVNYLKENSKEIKNLEELVIISPDAGGVKRAESLAKRLKSKYPTAFISKRRNSETNEIEEMRLSGEVEKKDCLVIDDIIDSGGTQCEAAELLKKHGVKKLYAYATHGLFTKGIKELCRYFDRIITTNTHAQKNDGVEIIDVSSVFAEATYRAQKGLSISKLFE